MRLMTFWPSVVGGECGQHRSHWAVGYPRRLFDFGKGRGVLLGVEEGARHDVNISIVMVLGGRRHLVVFTAFVAVPDAGELDC